MAGLPEAQEEAPVEAEEVPGVVHAVVRGEAPEKSSSPIASLESS